MRAPRFSALVVEDDPIIRQYVMRALAKEEFQCNGAADGVEGTAALERGAYDDWISPEQEQESEQFALEADRLNDLMEAIDGDTVDPAELVFFVDRLVKRQGEQRMH
jgi:CheY-like chemotaxis protein